MRARRLAPLALALVLAPALAGPLAAQRAPASPDPRLSAPDSQAGPHEAPVRRASAFVRHGKWGAAALFAGSMALAIVQHESANDAYDDLRTFCRASGPCTIGADGRYADPGAEAIYQRVVSGDRASRVWLVTGQVALLGAAALFVLDLRERHGNPNIPFSGLLVGPGVIGVRVPAPY